MTNNQTYETLSQGFGNSHTAIILHHFLKKNDYDLSHLKDNTSKAHGQILNYNLSSLDYDWSTFSRNELGKYITFNSIDDIENDINIKTQVYLFIERLINERKLMSAGVKMSRQFFHEHLEKFCNFNNNPFITTSCTEDSHDITNTEYIEVNVILTKRITLEKFMDYIKHSDKYDRRIAEQREKHFGMRKQQSF